MILKYVCPDYRVKSLFDISAKWLKRNGYTKIVVDIDNTLLPRDKISSYRNHFRTGYQDKALAACEAFDGDVLIVESEHDDYVPHTAISSFIAAFQRSNSLSYRILKGADHALRDETHRIAYNKLLLTWIEEMVRRGRRPD